MKKLALINLLLLLGMLNIHAQEDATFKLALRSDTILLGNYFEVKFSLNNASGTNFSPPTFDEFVVIGGPNQSSSFSMVNGVTNQSMGFSYYLQPREVGNYFIEAASIEANGVVLETQPVEIIVLPNPDGEKADYSLREQQGIDIWGGGLFEDNWNMDKGETKESEKEEKKKESKKKKKKKRKIYRL